MAPLSHAGVFKIGGYVFNEANAVTTAVIVEGPLTLQKNSSPRFGRYSESFINSLDTKVNEFHAFDRSKSLGRLLGGYSTSDLARHISFPEPGDYSPMPNVHRCTVEITWKDYGLPNNQGDDFVVFEVGSWEGFALAVRKAGSDKFTEYRYQFANSVDATHNVNAVAFDLSKFGLKDGDVISAIRIRNLFNAEAAIGADKVDGASGEGFVIYPGDPKYKDAHPLRSKAGGPEFRVDQLGADIVYLVGLHNVQPLKAPASQIQGAHAATK